MDEGSFSSSYPEGADDGRESQVHTEDNSELAISRNDDQSKSDMNMNSDRDRDSRSTETGSIQDGSSVSVSVSYHRPLSSWYDAAQEHFVALLSCDVIRISNSSHTHHGRQQKKSSISKAKSDNADFGTMVRHCYQTLTIPSSSRKHGSPLPTKTAYAAQNTATADDSVNSSQSVSVSAIRNNAEQLFRSASFATNFSSSSSSSASATRSRSNISCIASSVAETADHGNSSNKDDHDEMLQETISSSELLMIPSEPISVTLPLFIDSGASAAGCASPLLVKFSLDLTLVAVQLSETEVRVIETGTGTSTSTSSSNLNGARGRARVLNQWTIDLCFSSHAHLSLSPPSSAQRRRRRQHASRRNNEAQQLLSTTNTTVSAAASTQYSQYSPPISQSDSEYDDKDNDNDTSDPIIESVSSPVDGDGDGDSRNNDVGGGQDSSFVRRRRPKTDTMSSSSSWTSPQQTVPQSNSNTNTNSDSSNNTKAEPEREKLLPGGILWADHGGNSQDLVLVTTKAIRFYKVSLMRKQLAKSHIYKHPLDCFWYEPQSRALVTGTAVESVTPSATSVMSNSSTPAATPGAAPTSPASSGPQVGMLIRTYFLRSSSSSAAEQGHQYQGGPQPSSTPTTAKTNKTSIDLLPSSLPLPSSSSYKFRLELPPPTRLPHFVLWQKKKSMNYYPTQQRALPVNQLSGDMSLVFLYGEAYCVLIAEGDNNVVKLLHLDKIKKRIKVRKGMCLVDVSSSTM
jgi:hypothetical protein